MRGSCIRCCGRPDGTLARTGWNDALDRVAGGFKDIIERHGPGAVAFYLSGQLLTEDYYVANKLMKGFLGSANVDTNSRLCMASSVAGHRRAFGADTVPGTYTDLDEADLIVLVGSNAAWCHPVLFQRMARNKTERGAKIVVIDPRRTATGADADLFLPVAPGMDTALFSGLLVHLTEHGALDRSYIGSHTSGFDDALARAKAIAPDIDATARATGIDAAQVRAFFELFRTTDRVVTCYSQGVNQSAQGTDKVNAIINCHLATGRIGKPGCGPFSLTGQPNAMGGREVGGLANMLAAHMGFSPAEVDRVRRFWNAPRMAEREGLKAVQMFEAIARGEIKALWVMATNPAVSLPRAAAVREALGKLELFVVSENVLSNDTVNAGAHVLLPAAAWGEKDGTVTNSERRISRQRAFLPLPGEAKPDWQIVSEVAGKLGYADAFAYSLGGRRLPRARRAVGLRERRHARLRHRRPRRALRCRLRRACAGAMAAARRDGARRAALLCRRRLLHRRPQGPLHRARTARLEGSDVGRLPAASQHRPHPRPVAHHDAHRHEPAARDPSAGAVRRGASRRRPARSAGRRRLCARRDRARRLHREGRRDRGPAAGLAVPADPLERRHRLLRARRRSRRALHRSLFRPAGGQGDAGIDRTGHIRDARLRAHAIGRSRCRTPPGGHASRPPTATNTGSRPITAR